MMKVLNRFFLFLILVAGVLMILVFLFPKKDWRVSAYEIQGIDISHYQEVVDFKAIKENEDIDFVFVKATEGKSIKDKHFKNNWKALKTHQFIRGAYHFYRPSVLSKTQAEEFIKTVPLEKGDLPPVLDLEETDNRSKEIIIKGVKNWLDLVEKHYKVKPIIYVNQDFYKNYIEGNFEDYPIWLAAYRRQKPNISEGDWQFWQYTDEGHLNGIEGYVDKNVFYGSQEDLQKLLIR